MIPGCGGGGGSGQSCGSAPVKTSQSGLSQAEQSETILGVSHPWDTSSSPDLKDDTMVFVQGLRLKKSMLYPVIMLLQASR